MKTRKSGLLQRMTAVLLTAVLVVGMTSNDVPNTVLAQEDAASSVSDGWQESTEGNTEEPAEGNTKPEEKASAPAETTNPEEPKQETPKPDEMPKQETPVPEEEPKQETPKQDGETAEQGTVSGNDAAPQDGDHVNLYDVMPVNEVRTAGADTSYEVTYRLRDLIPRNHYDMDISLSASNDVQFHYTGQYGQANYVIPPEVIEAGLIKCVCKITSGSVEGLALKLLYADAQYDKTENGADTIFVGDDGSDGVRYIGFMNLVGGENDIAIGSITFTVREPIPAEKYTVTVNNGTGGGEYEEGETVTITANSATSGKQFDKWVVNSGNVTLVNATNSTTTFTMPSGEVEVTATYKDIAEEHEHDGVTFTPWTETTSLPTAAGNYYLTQNVTLSGSWWTPNGETTLCLNGKTISGSGEHNVIETGESCTLKLYDCQNAGKITGGKGCGVKNYGIFHMYGGMISSNGEGNLSYGGGVYNFSGTFQMYGGEISGNSALHGGGVFNGGTFQMYGGEISGNSARYGGGVSDNGTFQMYGGEISRNSCTGLGGGVCGGIRVLTVGGSAVISGNTSNGTENNVYFLDGLTIELDSSNPLSEPAKIGVTTATAPTEGNPVNITGHNKGDYSSYFTSDNPAYEIVNANDVVQLAVKSQTHTHNLTLTPAKPATCTEDGNTAYYTCDGCDKWFSDAAGTQEITDKTSVVITKRGHEYDETAWGYRAAEGHAHKCKNCDAHDTVRLHTPGAAATESTPQTCTVCGYIIAPATGAEPGTVTLEVEQGDGAPKTNISTPAEDLREMLLTDDEKQKVQNGTDVKIILEVKDAGSTVSDSDKAAIQQILNGFTVGQYLNIDLYKLIDGDRTDMHETAGKIRIVINVPDSLKNTDSKKTRTFAVIRVHNGNAELLTDLDNNADTITMETDRFSTYAIVYKDTANGGSGGENSGGGNGGNDGDNGSGGDNNGGSDNGNGSAYNNGGDSNSGVGNNNNGGTGSGVGSAKNSSQNNAEKITVKQGSAKDGEPKTGDDTPLELSATLAMIAGFAYLLLYFADRERGMTEETKKELVSRLVGWAKQGGRIRRYLALAAIFGLLVYYHSIGKKMCTEWKAIYGE